MSWLRTKAKFIFKCPEHSDDWYSVYQHDIAKHMKTLHSVISFTGILVTMLQPDPALSDFVALTLNFKYDTLYLQSTP